MACEFYDMTWDGGKVQIKSKTEPLVKLNKKMQPEAPWSIHSSLGDDNKIWCAVYRANGQNGGIFILRDFDEMLMIVETADNMAFLAGLNFFAEIVNNSRYGADIFENIDADEEE